MSNKYNNINTLEKTHTQGGQTEVVRNKARACHDGQKNCCNYRREKKMSLSKHRYTVHNAGPPGMEVVVYNSWWLGKGEDSVVSSTGILS